MIGGQASKVEQTNIFQAQYQRLKDETSADPNSEFLAQILASWLVGEGALPAKLGLEAGQFEMLRARYFPHIVNWDISPRDEVEAERAPELQDVKALLLEHRSKRSDAEIWIAQIVAVGCMGSDHLWSDLGLVSRKYLGLLLMHNFAPLAEQNDKNMRWKKFFYRQLCAKEGFIMCRSPSCETCSEYQACFAEDGMFG